MTIRPIKTLMNHATTEIFLDGVEVPADALVGEEGKGFRYILDGMNAERDPDRGGVHRRRALVRREGDGLRVRAGRLRPPDRREPGHPVPDRAGTRRARGRRPDALQGRVAVRAGRAVRRRGEHGEAARARGVVGRPRTPASTPTAASASPRSTTSSASSARRGSTRSRRSRTTWSSPSSASTCSGCRGRTRRRRKGRSRKRSRLRSGRDRRAATSAVGGAELTKSCMCLSFRCVYLVCPLERPGGER